MESNNYHEDVVDEENKAVGVGRWYECIFCKRGFNTAQALGGHMNIHRKHSARNKPNSTTKQQQQQQQHNPRSRHQPHFTDPTCFPSSNREHPPQPSNDWRMSFSMVGDVEINNRQASNQDKELDLELRLGYHS